MLLQRYNRTGNNLIAQRHQFNHQRSLLLGENSPYQFNILAAEHQRNNLTKNCIAYTCLCLYDRFSLRSRKENKLHSLLQTLQNLTTIIGGPKKYKKADELLVLLARKVVVIWISFPTEHRKCLPHGRFQWCLLLSTVRKYVIDTQEIIILYRILIVRVVSLRISATK